MEIDGVDNSLRETWFAPELIIRNYVEGDDKCNYELYLMELVNSSQFFLSKNDGHVYHMPDKQDHSECDCIGQSYEIDFKIAESYTLMQARSIFYTRPICVAPGVRFNTIPKVTQKTKGYHPIKATMLHKALRRCKEEDLESLYENKNVISPADKDICRFLKVLKTKKNLLLFIPVKFYFDK